MSTRIVTALFLMKPGIQIVQALIVPVSACSEISMSDSTKESVEASSNGGGSVFSVSSSVRVINRR